MRIFLGFALLGVLGCGSKEPLPADSPADSPPAALPPAPSASASSSARASAPPNPCIERGSLPDPASVSASKESTLRALLDRGRVLVWVSPTAPGVRLPESVMKLPYAVIEVGHAMPTPIRDLRIDERAMTGMFSFEGTAFNTRIPYEAVFGLTEKPAGLGSFYAADVPEAAFCESEAPLSK